MERQFKCVLDYQDKRITVNVFAKGQLTSDELKPLAVKRGIEFLNELGTEVIESEIKPIGYIDCGLWPPFY